MELFTGAVSLSVILILALYGLAKLVEAFGAKLLRPKKSELMLLLVVDDTMTDVEHQIRAAQETATRNRLPLYVIDRTDDTEIGEMTAMLLRCGVGTLLSDYPSKKIREASCD